MTPKDSTWKRVIFGMDFDENGYCPECDAAFSECECPGPTMDGYEYQEVEGILYGRPQRTVSTPGEILRQEFLKPHKMTQTKLARLMDVPVKQVNKLVHNKEEISLETAHLLANVFRTTPKFWLNLQTTYNRWKTNV